MFSGKLKLLNWFHRITSDHRDSVSDAAPSPRAEAPGDKDIPVTGAADDRVNSYSRRMMPPFTGQLQIAETGDARALSIDGKNWELQFRFTANTTNTLSHPPRADKAVKKYTSVASITPGGLLRQPLHSFLDTEAVTSAIDRLFDSISRSDLPYPATDRFEYWLLDEFEQKPLALLHSCTRAEEMGAPMVRPAWQAMPAAQLSIEETGVDHGHYVTPVNARLESLVAERAGHNPKAAWFDRAEDRNTAFPPCLIREDWGQEEHDRLCRLYIQRLAPRLLMLQGLAREDRTRLELACRENAADVERFHPLYPEVIDQKLLQALRVEARLRKHAGRPAS